MTAHSAIARRRDAGSSPGIQFDDERWRSWVPIRLPLTVCIQERLPPGAAALLLNRSHRFHDLILVIDAREKRMFDVIDGRRSITEIVERAGGDAAWPAARTFFEKLWWYDQVVYQC